MADRPRQHRNMLPIGMVEPDVQPLAPFLAIGQVLHQQLVPLELTATGSISAATASNALTATIGTF